MDVFVIPRGDSRYALYCEAVPGGEQVAETSSSGLVGRLTHGFAVMLRAAEAQDEGNGEVLLDVPGWLGRVKQRFLHWVAERVVEQRLLWRLRRELVVTVVHPEDMPFDQVRLLLDRDLKHDRDRHRNGLVVFSIAFALSGLVAVIPGPNLIAYYFAFRLVGHWLSWRGATQGLHNVQWNGRACSELLALREAVGLAPAAREARVRHVAHQLQLPHLPRFFARLVAGSA